MKIEGIYNMKLKKIDKNACLKLREAINKSCAHVAKELGVVITAGSGSYLDGHVIFKVECAIIDENGEVCSKEANDFVRFTYRHGLPKDALGKPFNVGACQYKLIGYKPRARRFPVIGKCIKTGKRFKFPVSTMKLALGVK